MVLDTQAARAYVAIWLVAVGAAMAGLFALIAVGLMIGAPDVTTESLVRHRAEQLRDLDADLVVVGDSSAGYGIQDTIGEGLGVAATNLALNGSLGFEGTRDMIERARRSGVRRILIVQTVDMLGRPPPNLAHARALPFGARDWRSHGALALRLYNSDDLLRIAATLARVVFGQAEAAFPRDIYRSQRTGRPLAEQTLVGEAMLHDDPQALAELTGIADDCARARLDCTYAHGPLWDRACSHLAARIAHRSRQIRALESPHFRLLSSMPVCMPTEIVGNTPDHVKPERADITTKAYAELLLAAWAADASSDTVKPLGSTSVLH